MAPRFQIKTPVRKIQNMRDFDQAAPALAYSKFRARFHLRTAEQEYLRKKGLSTVRAHATDLLTKRLAPAAPLNDGKQTPFKGHPVFIAQHATATCCRGCLAKWYGIPKGRDLTDEEIAHAVSAIERWLRKELEPPQPL